MKKTIYMIFLISTACILGTHLANLFAGSAGLSWLAYSMPLNYGPATFNFLYIFDFTFGFDITINASQVIMILVVILVYTKTAPKIFS